jgi:hypothetical protein
LAALIGYGAALGLIRNVGVDWSAEKQQSQPWNIKARIGTLPKDAWNPYAENHAFLNSSTKLPKA